MSGESITAWRAQVTHEMLLQLQLSVPAKRRPSVAALDHVGLYLATCLRNSKGYVDETEAQIATGLHRSLSASTVGDALSALRPIWRPITRGAKGHGTRRVFVFHDPKGLLHDSATERDYPAEIPTTTERDYPAEIETDKDGICMTTERDNSEPGRGNPVTPDSPDNAPSASAETASVRSPETGAHDRTQPTPRCTVCAAEPTETQNDLATRLQRALKVDDSAQQSRWAQKCVTPLVRHRPDMVEWQHLEILRKITAQTASTLSPFAFAPHDDSLQLADALFPAAEDNT